MRKKGTLFTLWFLILNSNFITYSRSVHRPINHKMPQINARWVGDTKEYTLKDSHLEQYPIFKIKAEDSYKYFLPQGSISYRNNPEQSVESEKLKQLIEDLWFEIKQGIYPFTHFTVIHKTDFNAPKKCGLFIAKFKDYPFILKISMEQPETFVNPYCKGIVPMYFFFMSGGSNRHMTGLTRIINLEKINALIKAHPQWSQSVQTPRKWFWLPNDVQWMEITGKNLGNAQQITTQLPNTYGIIADAIETDKSLSISKQTKNKNIMRLCNDLNLMVDPHSNNFIFQTDPITKKPIIVIIDTEHFPSIVGLKKKTTFKGHSDWYTSLAKKCLNDMFFRTKKERSQAQLIESELSLF